MNNTYPDGFPLTPQEAIEFSYFLSESEKQEWREWLKTATPEQHNELVDILHSMWQDNQKQAIPEAFNGGGNLSASVNNQIPQNQPFNYDPNQNFGQPSQPPFVQQFPPQIPQNQPFIQGKNSYNNPQFQTNQPPQYQQQNLQANGLPQSPVSNPFDFNSFSSNPSAATNIDQSTPTQISSPTEPNPLPNFDFQETEEENNNNDQFKYSEDEKYEDENQELALRKMASAKYAPNPVLEDKTPPLEEFVYKNGNYDSDVSDQYIDKEKYENFDNDSDYITEDNENSNTDSRKEDKKKFFSSSKMRQSATREALEDIYKSYINSRDKSLNSQKEYDDNHAVFLDKVMNVVSNFEEISDYYETIIERILEVNDKVVNQAKEIQQLKNNTQSRGGISLQDQVDELRDDIDRLNRDLRTSRSEQRRKYDEVSTQVASFGADAYRQDGVIQRIDLMRSEIIQLQQKLGLSTVDKNITPKLAVNNRNNSDEYNNSHQTIDLRGVV